MIDIKRNSFELILDELSADIPLVTFDGVPEDAYYRRIFRSMPMLRVCHSRFWRYITETMDKQLTLARDQTFLPIGIHALHLQTLVLREYSPAFLAHLLEHLPRLRHLTFQLTAPWLPNRPLSSIATSNM